MGELIGFPNSPRMPIRVGNCPDCNQNNGTLFDGSAHWTICLTHMVKWRADPRLFATRQTTDTGAIWSNRTILARMREACLTVRASGRAQ